MRGTRVRIGSLWSKSSSSSRRSRGLKKSSASATALPKSNAAANATAIVSFGRGQEGCSGLTASSATCTDGSAAPTSEETYRVAAGIAAASAELR